MTFRTAVAAGLCLLTPSYVFADFQYDETTKITGGAVVNMMKLAGTFSKEARQANAPQTSTVLVKGNRMAHIDPSSTEITDLDKETVTRIDHVKKTYTVTTFEQMKQAMERAREKASQQQPQQAQPAATDAEMKFKVNVRNTGATRDVAGLTATEAILQMTMEATDKKSGQTGNLAMTNDMWMAPEIPGYGEVRDFEKRMAIKMGMMMRGSVNPAMLAAQPGMLKGTAEMAKEMSKLKGVPVMQIMRIGSSANGAPLPAASEAPLPASNGPAMPSAGDVAGQVAANAADAATTTAADRAASKIGLGGVASSLGGFGGFGKKKKQEQQQAQQQQAQQQAAPDSAAGSAGSAVLMESSTELSSFSSKPLDNSRFEVPAGYKQVPSDVAGAQ